MLFVPATLEAIAAAKEEADYYRISIGLIRYATPLEIAALADNKTIAYAPFRDWLGRLHDDLRRANSRMSSVKHNRISEALSLYSSGGPDGKKSLVIGFCGGTHDLCAPTALILQHFPEREHDVLVVRDMQVTAFTAGIPGYAAPLPAAIDRLRTDFVMEAYREIRTFGVSSGGAAALLAGALLGARKAISICGRPPTASSNGGNVAGAIALEDALRASSPQPQAAAAVFAEHHRVDAENARRLARLIDLTLIPVPNLGKHSILKPLHQLGQLAGFFRSIGLTG